MSISVVFERGGGHKRYKQTHKLTETLKLFTKNRIAYCMLTDANIGNMHYPSVPKCSNVRFKANLDCSATLP